MVPSSHVTNEFLGELDNQKINKYVYTWAFHVAKCLKKIHLTMQAMQEMQVQSLDKEMATNSSILAWKIHGQRSLADYSSWGHKESDMTKHTHTHCKNTLCSDNVQEVLGPLRAYNWGR